MCFSMHVFSNIVVLIYFIIFKIDLLEMKKAFASLLIVLLKSAEISAQSLTDAAVQIVATAVSNPPQITLRWPGNASTLQYQVFRKLKSSGAWGAAMRMVHVCVHAARQRGLGQIAPVASNDTLAGRLRNRRVEVWIRPVGAATAVGGQR
jgi:hypothetical protein